MTVVRWEENNGNITTDAAYGAQIADGYASGQNYRGVVNNAGKQINIAIATGSNVTGALLGCTGRSESCQTVTVQVDVGLATQQPAFTWNQYVPYFTYGTAGDSNYTLYRMCCLPIVFVGNLAHNVRITSGASGFTTFDFIDLFTAQAPSGNLLHGFGHSWLYGVTDGSNATRRGGRFLKRMADYLGMTEDNYGAPGASLANGSWRSGFNSAGTTLITAALATTQFYNPSGPWTPDWLRPDQGANWPVTQPVGGPLTLALPPGGPQYGSRRPARFALMHGQNDMTQYYYERTYGGGTRQNVPGNTTTAGFQNQAGATIAAQALDGFVEWRFRQRTRELIARAMLEIPAAPIDLFGMGNDNNGNAPFFPLNAQMDASLRSVAQESWVPANLSYIPIMEAMKGSPVSSEIDGTHPNDWGHEVIFQEWRKIYEAQHMAATAMGVAH